MVEKSKNGKMKIKDLIYIILWGPKLCRLAEKEFVAHEFLPPFLCMDPKKVKDCREFFSSTNIRNIMMSQ